MTHIPKISLHLSAILPKIHSIPVISKKIQEVRSCGSLFIFGN